MSGSSASDAYSESDEIIDSSEGDVSSEEESDADQSSDPDDEDEPVNEDEVSLPALLQSWYEQLQSRRVELVGDYAGSELFLIEGDSLLLHCFADPKLDFTEGFQLLHAVYLVESFLDGLARRNCHFHVTFFDDHEHACVPPHVAQPIRARFLLARDIIIRHLQAVSAMAGTGMLVKTFKSIKDSEFEQYLDNAGIYFVMAHDGASPTIPKKVVPEFDERQSEAKSTLRGAIALLSSMGYNVALINSVDFMDTKVFTMVLEGRSDKLPERLVARLSSTDSPQSTATKINPSAALQGKHDLTKSEFLTLAALVQMLLDDKDHADLAPAFLLHTAILQQARLCERDFPDLKLVPECSNFLDCFAETGRSLLRSLPPEIVTSEFTDLVDGRLLNSIVGGFTRKQWDDMLDESVREAHEELLKVLNAACPIPIPNFFEAQDKSAAPNGKETLKKSGKKNKSDSSSSATATVLPFKNDVFDSHLAPIKLDVDASAESSSGSRIFQELSHWHNAKRSINPKKIANSKLETKADFFARKRNQRFMAEMTTYASSLTNAVGKVLEPETIIVSDKKSSAPPKKQIAGHPNGTASEAKAKSTANKKPKAGGGRAKAQESAALLNQKKQDAASQIAFQAWDKTCTELEKELDPAVRFNKTKAFLSGLAESRRTLIGSEVELYMLNSLLKLWAQSCHNRDHEPDMSIAALIWTHILSLVGNSSGLTRTINEKIRITIEALGLPQLDLSEPENDRKLSFSYMLPTTAQQELKIPMSAADFQLLHCGPYFDRSMDSAADDRVPFKPDGWQRKVLDAIDERKSLFVVAPTSAGKTFISFYAMKQILESNDNDVLVYVAPTKALVNQIAAEVQARFSKSFKYGGRSVWGIHTRDYRINNPTGCQVLVTVPHVLQIMLLAPSNAEKGDSWSNRMKRIIFDEVHCIGQADDGLIWEQLLLLAPCPIIALSATVGNPDMFSGWLRETQEAAGNELAVVQHQHRFSDLRKFAYLPPKTFDFKGLGERPTIATPGLDESSCFAFIHPVACLTNRARGMPDDLSLEARDCLILWKSMEKHQSKERRLDPSLNPSKSLPAVIRKSDITSWEAKLKATLRAWMADPDSPFEAVVKDLTNSALVQKGHHQKMQVSSSETPAEKQTERDRQNLLSTTLPLLCSLHEQEALPAILFNYDRGQCEALCSILLQQLIDGESSWKLASQKWKNKVTRWEDWKRLQEKSTNKKVVDTKSKKGGAKDDEKASKAELQRDAAETDVSSLASFDPTAPIEGFHFADWTRLLPSEFERYRKELEWRGVPQNLIDALRRGVGVHHAGMNRKYRQVVEMLFRKSFLRVVIATGTLALGINMPCKTVVFSGDSVFLTALNFRQAAGRAGRRGFDVLGNVVFQGLSTAKVFRLLSSRLPDLNGHFPITTTLVLRLFSLVNESKKSPIAAKAVNALLSQSRLYLGGPENKLTVLHHLRFSIEYLRRQHLLSAEGTPLNFAGLVSHLYFTENSSFAFHALLKGGYLHKLCTKINKNPESCIRTLMLVMAHLFGRVPCRKADKEFIEKVVKRSSSKVFLPSLPKDAATVLRAHNDETLQIFKTYVKTYIDQHIKTEDNVLPLSKITVGGSGCLDTAQTVKFQPKVSIRSSFIALSGHQDKFDSISDLCSSVRDGVFLEQSVIPYVGLYPEESDTPLNAYLYDFFINGDVHALEKANRVRKSDVWFLLNDFSLILKTIITSFMNFMKLSPATDMDMLDLQGGGDVYEEQQDVESASTTGDSTTTGVTTSTGLSASTAATSVSSTSTKSKKTKVMDSWDDEDIVSEEEDVGTATKQMDGLALSDSEDEDLPAWEKGGEKGLMNVLRAFQKLEKEFNEKFRAMWA